MKKFTLISLLALSFISIFFITDLLSQKGEDKITAFNTSLTLETNKDYQKAIDELLKVYENEKKDYLINLRLGWLSYLKKDYAKSKEYYQIALSLNKKSVEAMLGITLPLSALNEWENVRQTYKDILAIDPNNYTANLRLGQSYLFLQDYRSALKHLEKVKSMFPGDYETNTSLGWTCFYLGKKSEAKDLFITTLMISPGDTLAQKGLKLVR
ncbi:MAG: tetratricopeptide repeat protein [Ignavibacteriales bacterium]|nr:tetratricopeptide repeat protein [Ignavibacteriales bacterium]